MKSGIEVGPAHPTRSGERLAALDALRGFALLGILGPNLLTFAWPFAASADASLIGPGLANEVGLEVLHVLFFGKMMFLFALLFGAGVELFRRKEDASGERLTGTWYRRMGALLTIGLVHGVVFWFGDILVWYSLVGMGLVWWLRKKRPGTLAAIASGLYVLGVGLVGGLTLLGVWAANEGHVEADELTSASTAGLEIKAYTGSFVDALSYRIPTLTFLWFLVGPLFFPALTGIMLFGMALTKWGVLTGERSTRFYAIAAGVLVSGGLVLSFAAHRAVDAAAGPFGGFVWQSIAQAVGIPLSLGYGATVVLLVKTGWLRGLSDALARVGRLAMTNYLLQTVVCTAIFYGWGLGRYASIEYPWLWAVMVGVWGVNILFSTLWLMKFEMGPMERVWRWVTYGMGSRRSGNAG